LRRRRSPRPSRATRHSSASAKASNGLPAELLLSEEEPLGLAPRRFRFFFFFFLRFFRLRERERERERPLRRAPSLPRPGLRERTRAVSLLAARPLPSAAGLLQSASCPCPGEPTAPLARGSGAPPEPVRPLLLLHGRSSSPLWPRLLMVWLGARGPAV
jgi:hypothetical protein